MSTLPALRPICRPMTRSIFDAGKKSAERIISDLFAQGQQGFWLPFTDFDSLTQDSAGTLPYTALQQPVGRVLDRSGRGNHASQVTSTARGVVSARVNALRNSAGFSSIDWLKEKSGSGSPPLVTTNYDIAPDGSMTATRVQMTINGGVANGDWARLQQNNNAIVNGASYDCSFWIKSRLGAAQVIMREEYSGIGLQVKNITTEWAKYTISGTAVGSFANYGLWLRGESGMATADLDILVWGPSISLQSQASLPYQRVNTPTDYDAVGFPKYLRLDGTDDSYTCGGGGSTTGFYYSDVIRPTGSGSRTLFYNSVFILKSGFSVTISPQNKLVVYVGNGSSFQAFTSAETIVNGELAHCAVWDDVTNIYMQVKGGVVQSFVKPVMPVGPATINLYNTGAVEHFNGQATEPIYRAGPPPNAYERDVIRNYQMQKAGML